MLLRGQGAGEEKVATVKQSKTQLSMACKSIHTSAQQDRFSKIMNINIHTNIHNTLLSIADTNQRRNCWKTPKIHKINKK